MPTVRPEVAECSTENAERQWQPAAMEHLGGRHSRPFADLHGAEASRVTEAFNQSVRMLDVQDGHKLEVYDLIPSNERGTPTVFVSGFYAEGDTLRHLMYDAFLQGRRALCFNAYHGIDISDAFRTRYGDKIAELSAADPGKSFEPQLRKVAALIAMLDAKGLQSVDLLGHSEGCIVSTIAAYLRPDLFAKKALLCPAGSVGDVSEGSMKARKATEDLVVVRQRVEHSVSAVRTAVHSGIQSLLPEGLIARAPEHSVRFRELSQAYGESGDADLSAGQFIQSKGTFRGWLTWLNMQLKYFPRLIYEYSRGARKQQLSEEFKALSGRRLDKWWAMMDKSQITIGAAARDQLFPPNEVAEYAGRAGISTIKVLDDATHGVHYFQPDKATEFMTEAFGWRQQNLQHLLKTEDRRN